MHRFVRKASPLGLALVIMGALLLPPAGAAGASRDASITLDPTVGPPTTNVKVSGIGFGADEQVIVTFDVKKVGTATTDSTGRFAKKVKAPASALPGNHQITATGQSSGLSASADFLVRTDWPKFQFDLDNSGYNPYENVLNPSSVKGLKVAWSFRAGYATPPVVANGLVYVGSNDGKVYALDASTGAKVWSFRTSGSFYGPAVANGVVYVASSNHYMYALDASTGTKLWRHKGGYSSLAVADGVVYLAAWSHRVYALDASTGAELWRSRTGALIESCPAVSDGAVYVVIGSYPARVWALDATTGGKLWRVNTYLDALSSPAVANGVVYLGASLFTEGHVLAFNASTGARLWDFRDDYGEMRYSSPAVANGVVYVGDDGGNVYALDASTGAKRWTFPTGTYIESSAAVANGVVYVGATDGTVFALDASTGAKVWSYKTGGSIDSGPAVADGVVYMSSNDKHVYAFDLP
jgi:eukaryotic-like serine/threonine-protein kinase